MPSESEALLTQSHILALDTLIYEFCGLDFPELTAVAVVVKTQANLFVIYGLLVLVLLLFDFHDDVGALFVPAQGTGNHARVLHLMLDPLTEAV